MWENLNSKNTQATLSEAYRPTFRKAICVVNCRRGELAMHVGLTLGPSADLEL